MIDLHNEHNRNVVEYLIKLYTWLGLKQDHLY